MQYRFLHNRLVLSGLFIILKTAFTQAQNMPQLWQAKGQVVSAQGTGFVFVAIGLHTAKDSALIKGTVTDSLGNFEFLNLKIGQYLVSGNATNGTKIYLKKFSLDSTTLITNLGKLTLADKTLQLAEVTITAKKPFIERRADRLIANISGSALAKGNNALEVLKKLPFLSADMSGQVILKGSGAVLVLVDGKNISQSTDENAQFLKNLRADNIEKVEIYVNPPAKFDAQGAAVVNIITKKDKMYSEIHSNYNSKLYPIENDNGLKYNNYGIGGNISYGHNKLKINGIFDHNRFVDGFDRTYLTTQFTNSKRETFNATSNIPGVMANSSIAVGYDIDPKNELYLKLGNSLTDLPSEHSQNSTYQTDNTVTVSNTLLLGQYKNRDYNLMGGILHRFDKAGTKKISLDASYGGFDSDHTIHINSDNIITQNENYKTRYKILKTDFSTLFKGYEIETGAKITVINSQDDYLQTINPSQFSYQETILAHYLSTQKSIDKWSFQAGLRTEWTQSEGVSSISSNAVERSYINFFPSLFVQYTASDNFSFNISANRRINRPSYTAFNPVAAISTGDAFAVNTGNSNLLPRFIYKYSIGSTIKNLNIDISYILNKNEKVTIGTDKATGILYNQPINKDLGNWTFNFYYPIAFNSLWQSTQSLTVYNNAVLIPNISNRAWYFDFNSDHTIQLTPKTNLEISIYYSSPQNVNYWRINNVFTINTAIKSQITKFFEFAFRLDNILGTGKLILISDYGNVNTTLMQLTNSRTLSFSLSYRFKTGNKFKLNRRKYNDGEIRN